MDLLEPRNLCLKIRMPHGAFGAPSGTCGLCLFHGMNASVGAFSSHTHRYLELENASLLFNFSLL
jgi:hypothetical protein